MKGEGLYKIFFRSTVKELLRKGQILTLIAFLTGSITLRIKERGKL